MAFTSTHKTARISPTKVRGVINLIRGKRVDEALAILQTSPRRGAMFVKAVVESARANADQKEADIRKLYVSHASVDSGPTLKRFQPKDRGRSHSILKRTSHIKVALDEKKQK